MVVNCPIAHFRGQLLSRQCRCPRAGGRCKTLGDVSNTAPRLATSRYALPFCCCYCCWIFVFLPQSPGKTLRGGSGKQPGFSPEPSSGVTRGEALRVPPPSGAPLAAPGACQRIAAIALRKTAFPPVRDMNSPGPPSKPFSKAGDLPGSP